MAELSPTPLRRRPLANQRRTTTSRVAPVYVRLLGVVVFLAGWELAVRAGWVDERSLGPPSSVIDTGWDLLRDGTLHRALWASTRRVLWALVIGAPIGAVLAFIAGLTKSGDALVDSNMQMLRYVPIIALHPLLIGWLGIGETTKVVLLAIGVAFPVYLNTHSAIRMIDARHHELADVLGLTTMQRIRQLVIPGALPGFLLGLRYATAVAWLLLIFAEQINAREGLGRLTANAQAFFKADVIVVVIVVYTMLGVACDLCLRAAERYLLRWQARR